MPAVKKVWIHARYKMHELSFHTQLWREMGLEVTQAAQCSDWTVRWSMRLQPHEWEDVRKSADCFRVQHFFFRSFSLGTRPTLCRASWR